MAKATQSITETTTTTTNSKTSWSLSKAIANLTGGGNKEKKRCPTCGKYIGVVN